MLTTWTEAHSRYPGLTRPQQTLSGEAIAQHDDDIEEVIITSDIASYKHKIATDQEPPTIIYLVDKDGEVIYQPPDGESIGQALKGRESETDHIVIVDYNHPSDFSNDLTIVDFSNVLNKLASI